MIDILIRTLPFFAIIGLGYWAGRTRFFTEEATAYLTKFVFYFPLSAMLFRFSSNLSLGDVYSTRFALAYLTGCITVYLLATAVAVFRRLSLGEAAIEAQCAIIGNTGFLGVPMLTAIMGKQAAGPILLCLSIDLIVFSSLFTLLINLARSGRVTLRVFKVIGKGLLGNPMIVSMGAGLIWASTGAPVPGPLNDFAGLLGAAATPGALFAIGASLASKSAERMQVAGWLSFCKLVLHPSAVAISALLIFHVDLASASVMIAAASLPVAGNVYMLAQHYGVAPQRVSASILISTVVSILTVPFIIAWVDMLQGTS